MKDSYLTLKLPQITLKKISLIEKGLRMIYLNFSTTRSYGYWESIFQRYTVHEFCSSKL